MPHWWWQNAGDMWEWEQAQNRTRANMPHTHRKANPITAFTNAFLKAFQLPTLQLINCYRHTTLGCCFFLGFCTYVGKYTALNCMYRFIAWLLEYDCILKELNIGLRFCIIRSKYDLLGKQKTTRNRNYSTSLNILPIPISDLSSNSYLGWLIRRTHKTYLQSCCLLEAINFLWGLHSIQDELLCSKSHYSKLLLCG